MGARGVRTAALVLALVVGASCSAPERNEGAARPEGERPAPAAAPGGRVDASLTGRVVAHDGSPLAGLPVTVVEDRSGAVVDAALSAVFTLGIACVATPRSCDVDPRVVDAAATGADGRFELRLPQAYLPGFETDEDWVVQVGRAPLDGELTGPSSSFELEVNTGLQAAPDVALWDATPVITEAGAVLRVDLAKVTGGSELQHRSVRFIDDSGAVLWTVGGTTVDPRVLEDRSTRLVGSGSADVAVAHADGRTIYHQKVTSPSVAYVGKVSPISRGAACTVSDGALVGCPFTDGDLTTLSPSGGGATVDLGAPKEVGLVVVRGTDPGIADGDIVVEGSTDGSAWRRLPHRRLDGAEGWSAGTNAGEVPSFRYLRVGAGSGVEALSEISVFGPTAADRVSTEGSAAGGRDRGPVGAAAAALVILVGAAAVAARRLRKV